MQIEIRVLISEAHAKVRTALERQQQVLTEMKQVN